MLPVGFLFRGLALSRASSIAASPSLFSLLKKKVPMTLNRQKIAYMIIGKGAFISAINGENIEITLEHIPQIPKTVEL